MVPRAPIVVLSVVATAIEYLTGDYANVGKSKQVNMKQWRVYSLLFTPARTRAIIRAGQPYT